MTSPFPLSAFIEPGTPFVALISPSVRELYPRAHHSFVAFFRSLGAVAVYPVDAGIGPYAEQVAQEAIAGGRRISILGACPAAKDFVRKEFPALAPCLSEVRSPMSLLARIATEGAGGGVLNAPAPVALALTPCAIKKVEGEASGGRLEVVTLAEFLAACGAAGIDPASFEGSPYDPWDERGAGCGIGCRVVDALHVRRIPARAIKLDGAPAAREGLAAIEGGGGDTLIVEITFCEGGCKGARGLGEK